MKDNANFLEFATFFFIIAFSVTMTKMQWDYKQSIIDNELNTELQAENDVLELIEWNDRVTRIKTLGAVKHDGDPDSDLFDIVMDASSYVDPEQDIIDYSWTYLRSWDNKVDRNSNAYFDAEFSPDTNAKKVDLSVVAGIHEFELVVSDSYGVETVEVVTIEVYGEPNGAPVGQVRATKK